MVDEGSEQRALALERAGMMACRRGQAGEAQAGQRLAVAEGLSDRVYARGYHSPGIGVEWPWALSFGLRRRRAFANAPDQQPDRSSGFGHEHDWIERVDPLLVCREQQDLNEADHERDAVGDQQHAP